MVNIILSLDMTGASKHLEYGISVNGAAPVMYQREFFATSGEEQHCSLSRIVVLTAGQTLSLQVRTTDTGGMQTVAVRNNSFNATMVGG